VVSESGVENASLISGGNGSEYICVRNWHVISNAKLAWLLLCRPQLGSCESYSIRNSYNYAAKRYL